MLLLRGKLIQGCADIDQLSRQYKTGIVKIFRATHQAHIALTGLTISQLLWQIDEACLVARRMAGWIDPGQR